MKTIFDILDDIWNTPVIIIKKRKKKKNNKKGFI